MIFQNRNFLLLFLGFLSLFSIISSKEVQLIKIDLDKNERDNEKTLLSQSSTINLLNQENLAYVGLVQIGTPAQNFYVIYDTGSNDLFVQQYGCQGCTVTPSLGYTPNVYKSWLSSTSSVSTNKIQLSYGSLTAYGYKGNESVWLNGHAATAFKMIFVYQEGSSQFGSKSSAFDGIMGLSNAQSNINIFEQGKSEGVLNTSLFAFDLANNKFYYDDIDQKYLDAPSVPCSMDDRWTFTILGLHINGQDYTDSLSSQDGLVDSGTSLIYLSNGVISAIVNSSSKFSSRLQGAYSLDNCAGCLCQEINFLPVIEFYSRGALILLPPSQYMMVYSQYCILSIQDSSQFGFNLLGDAFMRQLVVTYNKQDNEMTFYGPNSSFMTNKKTIPTFIVLTVFAALGILALLFVSYRAHKVKQSLYYNNSPLTRRLI
ncbi:eukaryotic aspartyl protease (macronuclear) [Tetrahymena thermophila SB210]|uniref:Eukaryotic aspartyl protease n=1 Tax=Tetrahymena thermophila (strain SB210) TaxID=312017 RepID=I7LXI2_TETTS|nr:eukaryotic aspartyl protease [Tetrahymena thermophila SB210]EAS04691.2 eukaryotic aspartyl protease [Tetrahymena thermophila SB210]|eukprot:XP_001024936.2 eukaryotic aspartyl protease [Tetrahymena thermophila SB210]